MGTVPSVVAEFLKGKRFAVAGVSRSGQSVANGILHKLEKSGYDVVPVNPNASEIEGRRCYPDLGSIPGEIDGVVIATHPSAAVDVVRDAAARRIDGVWFHRSIGDGSVSDAAVEEARRLGLTTIVGGCPMMYCEPVDVFHRCMRTVLAWCGRIPA